MTPEQLARAALDRTGFPPARGPLLAAIREIAPQLPPASLEEVVQLAYRLPKPEAPPTRSLLDGDRPYQEEPEERTVPLPPPAAVEEVRPGRRVQIPTPRKIARLTSQQRKALRKAVKARLIEAPNTKAPALYLQLKELTHGMTEGSFAAGYYSPIRAELKRLRKAGANLKPTDHQETPMSTTIPLTPPKAVSVPAIAPAPGAPKTEPGLPDGFGTMRSEVGSFAMSPIPGGEFYEVELRVRVPLKVARFLNGTAHGLLWPALAGER